MSNNKTLEPTETPTDEVMVDGRVENLAVVSVTAPSDMGEGYEFSVESSDTIGYRVRVPHSVHQGEQFDAIVVESPDEANDGGVECQHNIPTGTWRAGLDGTIFCLGCWIPTFLLGQVLTRNKLNWCGNPIPRVQPKSFYIWLFLTVIVVLGNVAIGIVENKRYPSNEEVDAHEDSTQEDATVPHAWAMLTARGLTVGLLALSVLSCLVTCRARSILRKRYDIPADFFGEVLDDGCCAFWCGPCVLCVMANHTADHDRYPFHPCSATGLPADAPEVV